MRSPRLLALAAAALAAACAGAWLEPRAEAFPYVVKSGETLAQIAERFYGQIQLEQVLVAANGLDAGGGLPVVPGLRLEIPAVGHYRVTAGDTWPGLAGALLGDPARSDALAVANGAMPWVPPTAGQEIVVPYNLKYVAAQGDSMLTVAYRFLGERDQAWMLDRYNHKDGEPLRRGELVLVPLASLPLTDAGKAEAAAAGGMVRTEGGGRAREAQRRAQVELPELVADVRGGRYVEAVARGNRMLGYGDLTKDQLGVIQRRLTEAYVALDAAGLARDACAAWRAAEPELALDPVELSPKILRACLGAGAPSTAPREAAGPR
jgi:hypothetical protein